MIPALIAAGASIIGSVISSRGSKEKPRNDPAMNAAWWTGGYGQTNMQNYIKELGETLNARKAEIRGIYDPGSEYWNRTREAVLGPYARQQRESQLLARASLHKAYGANLANSPSAWTKFKNLQDEMSERYGENLLKTELAIDQSRRQAQAQGFAAAEALGSDMFDKSMQFEQWGTNQAAGYMQNRYGYQQQPSAGNQLLGRVAGAGLYESIFGDRGIINNWPSGTTGGINPGSPQIRMAEPSLSFSYPMGNPNTAAPAAMPTGQLTLNDPMTYWRRRGGYVPAGARVHVGEGGMTETIVTEDGEQFEVDSEQVLEGNHSGMFVLPFSMKKYMSTKYSKGGKGMGQGHNGDRGVMRSLAARGL